MGDRKHESRPRGCGQSLKGGMIALGIIWGDSYLKCGGRPERGLIFLRTALRGKGGSDGSDIPMTPDFKKRGGTWV